MSQKIILNDSPSKLILDDWNPSDKLLQKCEFVFKTLNEKQKTARQLAREMGHHFTYIYQMYRYYKKIHNL